ncbi:MAG: glucosamine-6-phosphate deaminase [Planctomycetes bacterium]|nr:glucosamine-6-phosphate deaminase [Planctomycetota bacterium]
MSVRVFAERAAAVRCVVDEIEALVRARAAAGHPCVLGLATGRTMEDVHAELVRRHRERGLSFASVHTVNLDEYWPVERGAPGSFGHAMHEQLFRHVDLPPDHILVPDGSVAERDVPERARAFEDAVAAWGGVDLQLLGIGRTGHLGFNEPGTPFDAPTRLVTLHETTRADAAATYPGEVPRHAITRGLGPILAARRVRLLAFGAAKASIVARALRRPMGVDVPASALRTHADALVLLDTAAAADLDDEAGDD